MQDANPKETLPIKAFKTARGLKVWQEAMNLVEMIYEHTSGFPENEMNGLTGQIRRAAVSIPSNIAEGNGRKGRREYLQFLWVANGSLAEVETQLLIAERLNYIDKGKAGTVHATLQRVGFLLGRLIESQTNKTSIFRYKPDNKENVTYEKN